MAAEDLGAADELRRPDGVVNAHGEVVADAQRGEQQLGGFPDQLHVHRQRRVAGVVEVSLGALDDEAAWVAAIRSIRQAAGMDGVDELDAAEVEAPAAAVVEGMGLGEALFAEPDGDLEIRDDGGSGPPGDVRGIGQVVGMPV